MASMAAAHSHGDSSAGGLVLEKGRGQVALRRVDECSRAHIDPSHVDPIVQEGLADEVILDRAARERAALIVLGSHENTPPLPPRMGRTVRHVLHAARCAVLVITPA